MSAESNKKRVPGVPFKKGVSGNPGGRPKSNLKRMLSEYAEKKSGPDRDTYAKLLVKRVYSMAINGSMAAIEFIWDRLEGKPATVIEGSIDQTHNVVDRSDLLKHLGKDELSRLIEVTKQ